MVDEVGFLAGECTSSRALRTTWRGFVMAPDLNLVHWVAARRRAQPM